jgi:multiple antibiotic resistance protein
MLLALKFCALSFSALLPLINPLGSALIFLAEVENAPPDLFRQLARKVAVATVIFLLLIEVAGAAILAFFGISLPVVQLAGGFALAAMGWGLLNQQEGSSAQSSHEVQAGPLEDKIFYPLTFPITAGPGCIVVTLTLSAHASQPAIVGTIFAHLGIALAVVGLGVTVWLSYAYAPGITRKVKPQTVHGILRVIAFVLLCIGVQIAWNGLEALVKTASK